MVGADVIVGLQWGSEGKGKIAAYLAREYCTIVRTGGPQAGHTFFNNGVKYVNRQLPCGVFTDAVLIIAPAAVVQLSLLEEEIRRYGLRPGRLVVDGNSALVTEAHIAQEMHTLSGIASTCEGVGAATADKVWRRANLLKSIPQDHMLAGYVGDTVAVVNNSLTNGDSVLIEGTQGFGLCLNHGTYPYVTSRDVTAAALLNDAGIAPKHHRMTIGVLRTYPIRVGGTSGPVDAEEITWDEIGRRSGLGTMLREYTTVTKRLRRVFEQDHTMLRRAMHVNAPDYLALMHIDYIDARDGGKTQYGDLSLSSKRYIDDIERRYGVPVVLIGTGPREDHIIDLRMGL